jgi:hypothetical protein
MKRVLFALALAPGLSFAAHPLQSDDTGTQGTRGIQFEINTDRLRTRDAGSVIRSNIANATLTYGLADEVDIAFNLPYQSLRVGTLPAERGAGDVGIEVKWRLYDQEGFSIGIKPQLMLATGNESRGLGNGKTGYGATLLAALDTEQAVFLANAGYTRNNNLAGARQNLWNLSVAALWKYTEATRLVLDVGSSRNADARERRNPAFVIAGIIYSPREDIDLDAGIRRGLNSVDSTRAIGAGLTLRW